MSRSHPVDVPSGRERAGDDAELVCGEGEVRHLLGLLNDSYCQEILEATGEEILTAREIADRCAFPLSTAYRKLDALTDADLLQEGVRLRDAGRNPSEYERAVDDIVVSFGTEGGMNLWITHRETTEAAGTES